MSYFLNDPSPPSIFADQNLTENFKFKIKPGHWKMIDPPIVTNQNLTENFKFTI